MPARCPQCSQEFDGTSSAFCPFDGTVLVNALVHRDEVSVRDAPSTTAALNALGELEPLAGSYRALIGQTLDQRYTIESALGEGGAGVVFLARHALIGKLVAVKVLKREAASDAGLVQRFVQEARAATRIGHPGIVDITDFGYTPQGLMYSVMEYIEGPTLSDVIRAETPMHPSRALLIAQEIAHALAAAHAKGIVHRDLKPENVFVLSRDQGQQSVKIVDFGIAKVTPLDGRRGPLLTLAGTVFGTPEYMAPEQAAGMPDIDHRADIYSLGVILYQMLSAELPHDGGETMRTLAMKMLDPARPLGHARPGLDISPALEQLVMHALARKPDDRIQTMDAFMAGLQAQSGEYGVIWMPGMAPTPADADSRSAGPITRQIDDVTDSLPTLPYLGPSPAPVLSPVPGTRSRSRELVLERSSRLQSSGTDDASAADRRPRRTVTAILLVALGLVASAAASFAIMKRGQERPSPASSSTAGSPAPNTRGSSEPCARGDSVAVASATENADTDAVRDVLLYTGTDAGAAAAHQTAHDPDSAGVHRPMDSNPHTPVATAPTEPDGDPDPIMTAAPSPRKQRIKILTQPEHANLYIDRNYSGKGGTTIEREHGTAVTVECRLEGYRTGRVSVRFDGENPVYLCPLIYIEKCVEGIKNPFASCP